jgi:ankyrin repeat protein
MCNGHSSIVIDLLDSAFNARRAIEATTPAALLVAVDTLSVLHCASTMGTDTASTTTANTATSIEDSVKSIYITIDPNEYDAGMERMRRAVRRCKSVDDIGYLDLDDNDDFLVPWYSVADDQTAVSAIKALQRKASTSPMKARRSEEESMAANSSKSTKGKKKSDPHAKIKSDFFQMLNIKDPSNGCSGFNVSKVNKMLDTLPVLACTKYLFGAFTEPVTALHMLCAMDAPLSCIKRCYTHNKAAIYDTSSLLGSPLHYACYYNSNIKIIRYICHQELDNNIDAVLCKTNRSKRTPLHLACMISSNKDSNYDNVELVQLLTSACANAALVVDKEGMTPLHYAVKCSKPSITIIEDLTEVAPTAGLKLSTSLNDQHQYTPLMMALMNPSITTSMVQDLIVCCPKVLQIIEPVTGNTPLHIAVQRQRPLQEIRLMVKIYPKALTIKNTKGRIPYKLAKSLNKQLEHSSHSTAIVQSLKPITAV